MLLSIAAKIANELQVREQQVNATIQLLSEGATVPFIARYRKEVTGNLDDTQLRYLEERLDYLRELEDRRQSILQSIESQGRLDASLRQKLQQAETKQTLEDLYLPFKPKRRTKAQIAREQGLLPLAEQILANPATAPENLCQPYLQSHPDLTDNRAVLEGAKHIIIEMWSENAGLLGKLRTLMWQEGRLYSQQSNTDEAAQKFKDYFAYDEAIHKIPSHRALALLRGKAEEAITWTLKLPEQVNDQASLHRAEQLILHTYQLSNQPKYQWLVDTARTAWKTKLGPSIENELIQQLREQAETEAIKVFAKNLKDLLLAAPAGQKATMGLDPGLRTGVKVAIVDKTGKLVATHTIYPHAPRNDWQDSLTQLASLVVQHKVDLIAVGNGTASRETDKLAAELIQMLAGKQAVQKMVVSEAGASVYSASELAAKEFPELDVSLRGAVSIARRLQDPLAELVKITPKSIGVGQYQHDVNQTHLAKSLDAVVEDCVNAVGVDLNTASAALLARISGLSATIAKNIVEYRDQLGGFKHRNQLKKVPRLGDKTFEQAAGFLRIRDGDNPLDNSAVHPESYPVVAKMLAKLKQPVLEVIGNRQLIQQLTPSEFVDQETGLLTIQDILQELEKPGRDPRPAFQTISFAEGVNEIRDLEVGMILNGIVTNVTNFGAFVDIGVHQDGLVHISMLSGQFVKDPHQVVKAGDQVRVKVMEVDEQRKRISLSMRLEASATNNSVATAPTLRKNTPTNKPAATQNETALSAAFAKLKR